jgi:DNA mismatch repair ATPase MutS
MTNHAKIDEIRRSLRNICDLEKLNRQLVLKKVYPQSIHSLYCSLLEIEILVMTINPVAKIAEYLINTNKLVYPMPGYSNSDLMPGYSNIALFSDRLRTCIEFIDQTLDIEKCANLNSVLHFETNIIQQGISTRLDKIQQEYSEKMALFQKTQKFFNDLLQETDFVKIHETEKLGHTLQITHKRGEQLQVAIHKYREPTQVKPVSDKPVSDKKDPSCKKDPSYKPPVSDKKDPSYKPPVSDKKDPSYKPPVSDKKDPSYKPPVSDKKDPSLHIDENFVIPVKDVRFKKSSSTVDEIDFPQLTRLQDSIRKLKDQTNDEIAAAYISFLTLLETRFYEDIENFANFVANLDLLQCKAYIAKKFNYCKPEIAKNDNYCKPEIAKNDNYCKPEIAKNDKKTSFFDVKDLRHVLIEHIQTNEIYVTNDLELERGLLIYGTNAVGKTSFIRSIGICIVLAQAGFYVPCSSFRYKPYTAIFSRILGNDNLFKGLSTFAVEMSELRVILKHADENSLILGDELCSGTEVESALSIFAAGLVALHEKKSTFLFATHFHEIVNYSEIRELVGSGLGSGTGLGLGSGLGLDIKHMAVKYDRERDCLLYDRKLADGPGNRMYGLEVCKSLHLDSEFLDKAFEFRGKYFQHKSELANPVSKYNTKKIKGVCERCGEKMGEEIHHLAQQKEANKDGFIGSFHKNHPANLASVCEECHREIHS